MHTEAALQEFILLPLTKKRDALQRLLLLFEGHGTIFDDLLQKISSPTVEEEALATVYTALVQSIQRVVDGNMQQMTTQLEHLKTYLDRLHLQEAAQNDPNDVELLLNSL